MNCKIFSNRLMDFVEGLLPHSEEVEMKEHIKYCKACRLKFEKIEKTLMILKEDRVPQLSEAKKQALFPMVMERIEKRIIIRRKRKWVYGLSFGFTLLLVFVISVIGIQNQKRADLYTIFFNPERFVYENDTLVNNYLLESIIEDDTLITIVKTAVNEEWVENSEMAVLINELSEDEINQLVEELRNIDFYDIL